jgi:ATP-binding cassette subfamily C protein
MKGIQKVLAMLTAQEKRRFAWLGLVVLLMGLMEVVGVVSILPFIQLVADPGIVDRSEIAHEVYIFFGFTSAKQMMLWAGGAVILLLCVTNGFSIFKTWFQHQVSWFVSHSVSIRLLKSYLGRPYEYFLNRNTTEFTSFIIGETTHLTNGIILPMIELASRTLVSLFIFGLLIWADPSVALVMFGTLGGAYVIIYLFQRRFLKRTGKERMDLAVKRYQGIAELFGGIKTVQVSGQDAFFANRYEEASRLFCDIQPVYHTTVAAPRFVMEVLAFGAIVCVTIYLYLTVGDIENIVPRLSLYAVAGYRLLPSLQAAFGAVGKLTHTWPVVEKLYAALYADEDKQWGSATTSASGRRRAGAMDVGEAGQGVSFQASIVVDGLSFIYENNTEPTLKDIDLTIRKGQTVAFVGSTGSGKTTLVDTIVGLLRPDSGTVLIDGTPLTDTTLPIWRKNIAYVPQDVFLFDDSVARNITLQEDIDEADQKRVEAAARLADIHEFVVNEMAEGYGTFIGEKGVRLSGGQRQRLGLARAFFQNPSVLVLDEATSALDNVTERGIIKSLELLPEEITTIVIAHRLSTVRHADRIFLLRNGKISAAGTFDELVEYSEEFQDMARAT